MLNRGIKTKLISSLVITILVSMTLFSLLLDRYLKDYSIKEAEKTILFLGENASSLLQKPLFNSDYNQLENITQPLLLADFDYLLVFDNFTQNIAFKEDKTGNNVIENLQLEGILPDRNKYEKLKIKHNGEVFTQYFFPVSSVGVSRPLGYLIIGISMERMKTRLKGITQRVLLVSLLLFLTLTFTIYFLADKIVKPIKLLSENMQAFAHGDYSVRSHINTNDEIRTLSDNFNMMSDKINKQISAIESHSKNLEKKVQERTEQLLQAMDAIKERDKRLNQAEKISSLNSIVSAIAHEINNPLAIISGNVQLLAAMMDSPETNKKCCAAEDAIQRIANLINEINFFSSIKNISLSPVSIFNLISSVIGKVVPEHISVSIKGEEDIRINSNSNLLTTSLENIIKNSVEMIEARRIEGDIQIQYSLDAQEFKLNVIDNAGGMKEPGKAFDPFYTTFPQKKGLGLTFVFHAIQALNGEVTLENKDSGVKVSVILPLEEKLIHN